MITAKELQQRRLTACVDDITNKIEAKLIHADVNLNYVEYSVLKMSQTVINEVDFRLRNAGYTVTRSSGSSGIDDSYDFLRIEWQ